MFRHPFNYAPADRPNGIYKQAFATEHCSVLLVDYYLAYYPSAATLHLTPAIHMSKMITRSQAKRYADVRQAQVGQGGLTESAVSLSSRATEQQPSVLQTSTSSESVRDASATSSVDPHECAETRSIAQVGGEDSTSSQIVPTGVLKRDADAVLNSLISEIDLGSLPPNSLSAVRQLANMSHLRAQCCQSNLAGLPDDSRNAIKERNNVAFTLGGNVLRYRTDPSRIPGSLGGLQQLIADSRAVGDLHSEIHALQSGSSQQPSMQWGPLRCQCSDSGSFNSGSAQQHSTGSVLER